MTNVRDINILSSTINRASRVNDSIRNNSKTLQMQMSQIIESIKKEVIVSTNLVAKAQTQVATLQAQVASLAAGLPHTAAALAAAKARLALAIKNLALMQSRLAKATKLQLKYTAFFSKTKMSLDSNTRQYNNLLDTLNTRLSRARGHLEEYLNSDYPPNTSEYIRQKSDMYEYKKSLYNEGKANLKDIEDSYKQKLESRKETFITSSMASEMGVEISEYNLPVFNSKFDTKIDINDFDKSREAHNVIANRALKEALESNDGLKTSFSQRQLEQIGIGYTPEGYTWHHDGNPPPGNIQLIESRVHNKVRHHGGYSLWADRSE